MACIIALLWIVLNEKVVHSTQLPCMHNKPCIVPCSHLRYSHACTQSPHDSPEKAAMNIVIELHFLACLIMDALQTSVHVVCLQATGACKMNRG